MEKIDLVQYKWAYELCYHFNCVIVEFPFFYILLMVSKYLTDRFHNIRRNAWLNTSGGH